MDGPDEMEVARRRLAGLVKEVEALANSAVPFEQFFPPFLERLLMILGAPGGAVWLLNGQGLVPYCQKNLGPLGVIATPESQRINDQFLREVIETGEARVKAADQGTPTPTPHVYLLAALHKGKETVGAVEVVQRLDAAPAARPGFLQFMEQMCGHASRYLQLFETRQAAGSPADFWQQFEPFVLRLQRSLDVKEVTATAANDARQLIQCDRTSVAVFRHGKTRVMAVSGTDSVNQRANLVRALQRLTHRVILARDPLHYTGEIGKFSPQIETPLADYISESGARMVLILPLFEPPPLISPKTDEGEKAKLPPRKPIGALIVEQMAEGKPRPGMMERATLVADHVAAGLHSAIVHNRLFLLPVWRTLGYAAERIRGRLLYKILAGLVITGAVVASMIYIPWEYKVEAKGRLMPTGQTDVFAPWDAQVVSLHVRSGDRVKQGDLLIELRSDDLQARLLAAQNQLSELLKRADALRAEIDEASRRAERNKVTELQGQQQQTEIEIVGAQEQARILTGQVEQLHVKAPADGLVTTFQIEQTLANRPVQRGEVLLEIMREDGPWRLELEIPDHRMGHVLRRQGEVQKRELPIDFMLATSTEVTYKAQLDTAATRTALTQDTGSVVEAFAQIDPEDFRRLQPGRRVGAEVTAWIRCGPKPLGYVLFGDVIEFIQKRSFLW